MYFGLRIYVHWRHNYVFWITDLCPLATQLYILGNGFVYFGDLLMVFIILNISFLYLQVRKIYYNKNTTEFSHVFPTD